MSSQQALKHTYLSMLAAASVGSIISVVGGVLTNRKNATREEVRQVKAELKAELASKAEVKQLELATKAGMKELQLLIIKKKRCGPW
jgi:acyl-coenzyme A synthetase/AMP-(fatty) acid ligase